MESGEKGDYTYRPEIDRFGPMGIFDYAREKLAWYEMRTSDRDRPEALGHLADELDKYTKEYFGGDLPEVVIQASDVTEPFLGNLSDGAQRLASEPRPFDEQTTVIGEHKFNATLHGFHVGINGDLRVYVQQGKPLAVKTPAGILIPFTSVAIEGSEIQLAVQKEADLYEKIGAYVTKHIADYDPRVRVLVQSLVRTLNEPSQPLYRRLQLSSGIIGDIAGSDTSEQFVDSILELISLKLGLNTSVSLKALSHRVKIPTNASTRAYRPGGERHFEKVSVTPEIIKGLNGHSLGLTFYYGNEVITVPAQAITQIIRMEQA